MQFSVLLRKEQNKHLKILTCLWIQIYQKNLQRQEREDRLEKERVKQLTLQINERQEEEEVTETIASMQRPTLVSNPRQERRNQQPPKGTPDVDWIFKSKPGGGS